MGLEAMQQRKWPAAALAFEKALKMATLNNDPTIIAHSWYNLSMAYKAGSQTNKAEQALKNTLSLAVQHNLLFDKQRAQLQLELIYHSQGKAAEDIEALALNLPADIYLMAGKLAYLNKHKKQAEKFYTQAMNASKENRSGLLLRAEATLGLALLAKEDGKTHLSKIYALKTLAICHTIGAPSISAHASLLLAGLSPDVSHQEALGYAKRAIDIYSLLHMVKKQKKAEVLLQRLLESHA